MKNESKNKNFLKLTFLFIALIFIDQLSKYLIRSRGGFYICNANIAFSIQLPEFIFWIIWPGVISFLIFSLYRKYLIHDTLYIILILAGALGNIIDRLYFGCVIDFIDLKFWPVFNLADVFISVGVIAIIITTLKLKKT